MDLSHITFMVEIVNDEFYGFYYCCLFVIALFKLVLCVILFVRQTLFICILSCFIILFSHFINILLILLWYTYSCCLTMLLLFFCILVIKFILLSRSPFCHAVEIVINKFFSWNYCTVNLVVYFVTKSFPVKYTILVAIQYIFNIFSHINY